MDRNKILLIFAGAWISAALLTWFLYRSTRAPKVEKTVSILAVTRDLAAGAKLQKSDLKLVRVFEAEAPKAAITDEKQALDRALLYPMSANEPVTSAKIAGTAGAEGLPATIEIGKRAIAVAINDSSGVAGLIQPRAHVDVLFTRSGPGADTSIILEDVVVLAFGRNTETTSASTPTAQAAARPAAQSATLLVTPEQARTLELAKNQGKISLALRNPLDRSTATDNASAVPLRRASKRPADSRVEQAIPPLPEPPKAPAVAVDQPPPPPKKKVVDVYRGDKHTQETF